MEYEWILFGYLLFLSLSECKQNPNVIAIGQGWELIVYAGVNFLSLYLKALKYLREQGTKKESRNQLSLEKETEPSEWIFTLSSEQIITYPFFVLALIKYFF